LAMETDEHQVVRLRQRTTVGPVSGLRKATDLALVTGYVACLSNDYARGYFLRTNLAEP